MGVSKPDPLIYQQALRACKVKAQEAVYIDDIPVYVDAARRLGLAGIHFQSPDELRAELVQAGIHVEDSCTT